MILLYQQGGGSIEVQLLNKRNPALWGLLKRQAIQYLEGQSPDSAKFLEDGPVEMWSGTNSFDDRFDLLYLKVSIEACLKFELEAQTRGYTYWLVADALKKLNNPIRFIAVDALPVDADVVTTPTLAESSATVELALQDFKTLLSSSGAPRAIDRLHTALHAYLIEICRKNNIHYEDDAKTTTLFKGIRENHPKFQSITESRQIVQALASIVDALNPVRNRHSMAHPTPQLLDEPEALLVANAVRTLLHYLNMKLQ